MSPGKSMQSLGILLLLTVKNSRWACTLASYLTILLKLKEVTGIVSGRRYLIDAQIYFLFYKRSIKTQKWAITDEFKRKHIGVAWLDGWSVRFYKKNVIIILFGDRLSQGFAKAAQNMWIQ